MNTILIRLRLGEKESSWTLTAGRLTEPIMRESVPRIEQLLLALKSAGVSTITPPPFRHANIESGR